MSGLIIRKRKVKRIISSKFFSYMMKAKWIAGVLLMAITISACDDDTATVGSSLTKDVDHFTIYTDTFNVATRSIKIDSVLSKSEYCYLGRIKDPTTGDYVTSDFTTQFNTLESLAGNLFPSESLMVSKSDDGQVIADSCHINIYINGVKGDTLAPMKLKVFEMAVPAEEGKLYYSDFDPEEEQLIRTDGISKSKSYTYVNFLKPESQRNITNYVPYINICINDPYTDKDGVTYNNYGTYLIRKYHAHPELFKNAYSFIHNVCPGFFVKTTDGAGLMSQVFTTELHVYYRFTDSDSITNASRVFSGTGEVLQTTTITNDRKRIEELVNDNTCTYLKTPAGIFTEVTLPIDNIMRGHESDTLTSAKIRFQCYQDQTDGALGNPSSIVMVPKAQLFSFFEEGNIPDNLMTFLATLSTTGKYYEFGNISTLITHLYKERAAGDEEWNKVVLVPVERTVSSSTSSTTAVTNLMSLTSTKLIGGSDNTHAPVTISVIYNKGD